MPHNFTKRAGGLRRGFAGGKDKTMSKCKHGMPFHRECVSCELAAAQAEVAELRRKLSDAEVRLAVRKNNSAARAIS